MPDKNTPRSTLTSIGAWKLGRTLGRGAYAHVRLATHVSGHKAACKILPALHHTTGQAVSWDQTVDAIEAHKEVVLLKALTGAGVNGIVGLEGVLEQGGWTYVFLTLYPHSASRIPMPWSMERLVVFFRYLLHSVHTLHLLDVSHEDIKRSNILVDEKILPAMVDFGFSHFRPGGGLVKSAGGTLDYSSPEKTADVLYDPRANDVWAIGILLIKLLNLPHPYTTLIADESSTTVKRRIISGEPAYQFPREEKKPGGLGELLMGMLERDPKRRWTIPEILKHPSLKTDQPDPPAFKPPSPKISFMHRIPAAVIEDICFLAHLNGEFALCETSQRIEKRLGGKKPCWEKQWAGMLGSWSKRAEMDWEAIPTAITPLKVVKARSDPTVRIRPVDNIKARALREIYLTPNLKTPARQLPVKKAKEEQKENIPPKRERKPRMYGMKTREESQRTITSGIENGRPMSDSNPVESARVKIKRQRAIPAAKLNKQVSGTIVEPLTIGAPRLTSTAHKAGQPIGKKTALVGESHDHPIVIEDSPSPVPPAQVRSKKGRGKASNLKPMASLTAQENTPPGPEQPPTSLTLTLPKERKARRRSPRIEEREQVASAA